MGGIADATAAGRGQAEAPSQVEHARSYPGAADQLRQVRTFLREVLAGYARADDAVVVASEFAANAVLHSRSGVPGGHFTVRVDVGDSASICVAVEDDGGPWAARACRPENGHGLDLVQGIAGPGRWGVSGDASGRQAWAILGRSGGGCPGGELRLLTDTTCPADDDGKPELEKLAAELAACGVRTRLISNSRRLACLEVNDARPERPAQRIYAQANWFFWPYAERIAACDDVTSAADAIVQTFGPDGASHA